MCKCDGYESGGVHAWGGVEIDLEGLGHFELLLHSAAGGVVIYYV